MKKISVLLLALFLFPSLVFGAELRPIEVFVNGEDLYFSDQGKAVIKNDRTFLPLRVVAEKLGYKVDWNQEKKEVGLANQANQVKMYIGKQAYRVNDVDKKMDVEPFIEKDRTYIPVRFLQDSLGLEIHWDEANRLVLVGQYPKTDKYQDQERILLKKEDVSLIIPQEYKERFFLENREDRAILYDKKMYDFFQKRDGYPMGIIASFVATEDPRSLPNLSYILAYEDGIYYCADGPGDPQGEEGLEDLNKTYMESWQIAKEIYQTLRVEKQGNM